MKTIAALLLLAGLAWADCDSTVGPGPTMLRSGKSKINYQQCHWESSYNPNVQKDEDAECFLDASACTFKTSGHFDARLAALAAPCTQGTSLPGTCSQGACYQKSTDGTVYFCTATNTWTQISTGAGGYATIKDEGSSLTQRTTVNFIGAPVSCVDNSGSSRTDCTVTAYGTVQDEGSALTQRPTVNFTGAGVSCADNAGQTRTDCTISGGGGSGYDTVQDEASDLTQRAKINFTGSGVSCADNAGASRTDCTITSGGGSAYDTVKDEGTSLTQRAAVNFIGSPISCADNSGSTRTDCTVTAYDTVADEGSSLTQRPTINFTGAGVSCVDNSGSSRIDCTISGGGGGGASSTTFLWLPFQELDASDAFLNFSTLGTNVLGCIAFIPQVGITGATKMAWGIPNVMDAGKHCGVAIYSADGSTRIATSGAQDCHGAGSSFVVTVTGISAFDLTAGTKYQLCICGDHTVGTYDGPTTSYVASRPGSIYTAFVATNNGYAANACSAGAPPTTTGSLTTYGTQMAPYVLLSAE